MTEKERKFLYDVIKSIDLIESFTKDLKSFNDYEKDVKTKGAVERHLGIIGKAINKFLKEAEINNLESASRIISLRNRLIHSYDSVDDSIIWSVLTRHLEPLKKEVKRKIEQS